MISAKKHLLTRKPYLATLKTNTQSQNTANVSVGRIGVKTPPESGTHRQQ
jgi:hypothetical protein